MIWVGIMLYGLYRYLRYDRVDDLFFCILLGLVVGWIGL